MNIDLTNYINQARKSGIGDDKIREGMLQAGWPAAEVDEGLKGAPVSPPTVAVKPKWHPTPTQKWVAIIGTIIILGMSGAYAYVSYVAYKNYQEVAIQAKQAEEATQALKQKRSSVEIYRNDSFGFSIELSESWKGYSINQIREDMYDLSGQTTDNNGVVDSFQIIELHHPSETPDNPYEIMPIMIFTPTQWDYVTREEWSVGAAPISPTILGQNSQWVMALPARYNYDYKPGWEEVDQLVRTLKAFEPAAEDYYPLTDDVPESDTAN